MLQELIPIVKFATCQKGCSSSETNKKIEDGLIAFQALLVCSSFLPEHHHRFIVEHDAAKQAQQATMI